MDLVTDPLELVRRLYAYDGPDVPAELADRLQMIPGVDADRISQGREILYAHYDLLNDQGRTVLGQLANYAVYSGWTGDNAEGRCEKIVAAVRRDLGEIDGPDPAEDPEPQTRYRADGLNWQAPAEEAPAA